MNQDLEMMKPKIYPENKTFCLTPESKLEKWVEIIHKKALEGYKVKLYSDIESTGFAYWSRGRAIFDENIDEVPLRKDAEKFFLEIEAITNEDFIFDVTHPLCSTKNFSMKTPTPFALFALGKTVFLKNGVDWERINNYIKDYSNDSAFYKSLLETEFNYLLQQLSINAKGEIKSLIGKAYRELKKEAIELSSKVDRMIEYAFVTCYENKDGEVFLLKDDDGELIYFHEFVYPNEDKAVKDNQVIQKMPLIPYIIHKTDFDFLKGELEHPFLKIKLDKPAPTSEPVLKALIDMFDYKGTDEEKEMISENIMMFFHNGNGFDVPFIDAEIHKFFENKKLRDYIQTYDTLKIAKAIIPSDVQKFIAACQYNKNFGGDESKKLIESEAIMPTSKSLDNVKRLASYLINFDPMRPKNIYKKAQSHFFELFKKYFDSQNIDWKKFENMLEYSNNNNPDLSLIKGFPKPKKTETEFAGYLDRYAKYLEGRKEYLQSLNKVKKFENIYENINNIKQNIENNQFLRDALYRLNNVDRSAHGARVDSQLFMDTFIVLENALYLKPKMSEKTREIKKDDIRIPQDIMDKLNELKQGAK